MVLNDIGMIAADTSRSRVYMQSLVRNNLLPNFVLVLANKDNSLLPGQLKASDAINNNQKNEIDNDCWSESNNDLSEPIKKTMEMSSIKFTELKSSNLHDASVIKSIGDRPESTFIYSGFGGVILRSELF